MQTLQIEVKISAVVFCFVDKEDSLEPQVWNYFIVLVHQVLGNYSYFHQIAIALKQLKD